MKTMADYIPWLDEQIGYILPQLEDALFNVPEFAVMEQQGQATMHAGLEAFDEPIPRGDFSTNAPPPPHCILPWKQFFIDITISKHDLMKAQEAGDHALRQIMEEIGKILTMTLVDIMGHQLYGDGLGHDGLDWDGTGVGIDDGRRFPEYGGIKRIITGGGHLCKQWHSSCVLLPRGPLYQAFEDVWAKQGYDYFLAGGDVLAVFSPEHFETLWKSAPQEARFAAGNQDNAVAWIGIDTVRVQNIDCVCSHYCPTDAILVWRKDAVRMAILDRGNGTMIQRTDARVIRAWNSVEQRETPWLVGQLLITGNFFFVSSQCMRIVFPEKEGTYEDH